jgi:hypothetical protein
VELNDASLDKPLKNLVKFQAVVASLAVEPQ